MPVVESDAEAQEKVRYLRRRNPWISAGLHTYEDVPEPPAITTWNPGFQGWLGKVALAPGTVSVVTGLPGSGKTHLWAQIWSYVAAKYDLKVLIASFECRPKPHYARYLRQFFACCREADMSAEQIRKADGFISDHYRFLIHPAETPTLEWIFEMAEMAVAKWGVKVIQIDPWNRLESQRGEKESETDYQARCLRSASVFSKDTGCHMQFVAHPAKRIGQRRDQAPDLEDISGSMHWWNMADQGFVVHRKHAWTKSGGRGFDAELFHRKARFEELGYPCVLPVRYNLQTRRFEESIGGEDE